MYRAALRSAPGALPAIRPTTNLTSTSRRFLTTAPAKQRRTWKGTAARWGLAVAAVYWYNTSPIFADEPLRKFTQMLAFVRTFQPSSYALGR